jgi:hypothetical protein
MFTVGRRSSTHVAASSRGKLFVIARGQHREDALVALQQLEKASAIEQDLDVPPR